ncbi:hypothetical protein ACRAWF_43410 [Streptomyces sp. L7]
MKRKARYYGGAAGDMGADTLYTFRPWQRFGVETSVPTQLGTERDEYYYVDPDTRTWHVVYPKSDTLKGEWSPLRTFTAPRNRPRRGLAAPGRSAGQQHGVRISPRAPGTNSPSGYRS